MSSKSYILAQEQRLQLHITDCLDWSFQRLSPWTVFLVSWSLLLYLHVRDPHFRWTSRIYLTRWPLTSWRWFVSLVIMVYLRSLSHDDHWQYAILPLWTVSPWSLIADIPAHVFLHVLRAGRCERCVPLFRWWSSHSESDDFLRWVTKREKFPADRTGLL